MRDVRHLRRKALNVLGLFVQQRLRDEEREVRVDVAGLLEFGVERLLNQLPDRVAVRPDHHATLDRRIVGELRAPDDIQVPAREVLGLGRDFSYERLGPGLRLFRHCDRFTTKDTTDVSLWLLSLCSPLPPCRLLGHAPNACRSRPRYEPASCDRRALESRL